MSKLWKGPFIDDFTVSVKISLIMLSSFRWEEENVKVMDNRLTSDAKWWQKLTWPFARQAKKAINALKADVMSAPKVDHLVGDIFRGNSA